MQGEIKIEKEYNSLFIPHLTREIEYTLLGILYNPNPTKPQRLYLFGWLNTAVETKAERVAIIEKYNNWQGYDKSKTLGWVNWFARNKSSGGKKDASSITKPFSVPAAKYTISQLMHYFRSNVAPVSQYVPKTNIEAVYEYTRNGHTCIPKSPQGKYPSIPWKQYQNKAPTQTEILSWDFSPGICLLANNQYSFLDIDEAGYEEYFKGWHTEKTPRGGVHVFGRGTMKSITISGAEIKGIGGLIISAPTPGYEVLYE